MKKIYFAILGSWACLYGYAQCTPRPLPFVESFSSSAVFSTCTPTMGGWVSTSAASGADWWVTNPPTNYAGGSAPEVEAYGDQANGGVSETIRLTSPPINTNSVTTYTLQFKHNLFLTNSGASGSGVINITVETSQDQLTWTQRHSAQFNATSSLTAVVNETRTLVVSSNTDTTTYIRFSISGVLFKVYGWEIDAVGLISAGGSTGIQNLYSNSLTVAPNPFSNQLQVNCAANENTRISLTDVLGKTVYTEVTNAGLLSIDTRSLPAGIYMLQVAGKDNTTLHKVVKE